LCVYLEVEFSWPGGGGGEPAFEDRPAPGPRVDPAGVDELAAVGLHNRYHVSGAVTYLQPCCTQGNQKDYNLILYNSPGLLVNNKKKTESSSPDRV
jgi:hypothetical protein